MIVPETGARKRASASAARRSGHLLKVNHAPRFVKRTLRERQDNRMNRAKKKYSCGRLALTLRLFYKIRLFRAGGVIGAFAGIRKEDSLNESK